ncbi:MAG TPA: IS200/IS605 family transposase [Nitrospirae bacterium]|nr:IS200/IS605 family transposase [Nitrospirota bacterium]
MVKIEEGIWRWYHNISECYYHIQLTVKYRKSLLTTKVEQAIIEALRGIKERYAIEISEIGFDQNHVHMLCRFLPKYSGGQVIRVIKSISAKRVFKEAPEIKKELWGGEFWTDGYYIATVSGKGNKEVIEKYIRNQGREKDIEQLKMFQF